MRQAATAAGFSPRTPMKAITKALNETSLRAELEVLGVNPRRMAERIADGQDALRMQLDAQGGEHWSPDWQSRFRYDTLVLRMFGIRVTGGLPEADLPPLQMNVFQQVFNLMGASIKAQRETGMPRVLEV